jgi:hypothetical protein
VGVLLPNVEIEWLYFLANIAKDMGVLSLNVAGLLPNLEFISPSELNPAYFK